MHHRAIHVLAATLAALSLSTAPALAGEDDDDGDDDNVSSQVENLPAAGSGGELSSAPQGGVATGLGGTAPRSDENLLLGLGTGALVLASLGGGLVAVRRGMS